MTALPCHELLQLEHKFSCRNRVLVGDWIPLDAHRLLDAARQTVHAFRRGSGLSKSFRSSLRGVHDGGMP